MRPHAPTDGPTWGGADRFGYTPCFDGIRALSILLVLGAHRMGPISEAIAARFAGWAGVDVFFVLSGFLITALLCREQGDTGRISLARFGTRRALRIVPAFAAYLAVMLAWYGRAMVRPALVAGLYGTDYSSALALGGLSPYRWLLGPTWSLAVEEQFYLVWPVLFLLAGGRRLPISIGLALLVWLWRGWLVAHGASDDRIYLAFDTRLDSLLTGCIGALLWADPRARSEIRRGLAGHWSPAILGALWLVSALHLGQAHGRGLAFWCGALPFHNTVTALFLLALLVNPSALVATSLSRPLMVGLGRLSYSLYLWHTFIFHQVESVSRSPGFAAELLKFVAVLMVAVMSHVVIERPFLRLKARWNERRSGPGVNRACQPTTRRLVESRPRAGVGSADAG